MCENVKKRRFLPAALGAAIALSAVAGAGFASSAAGGVAIEIDGAAVRSDTAPVVKSGTTLVPVRVITETLGAAVSWDQAKQAATIETAGYSVVFTIGSTTYTVNGAPKTLLAAPEIVNDRTMVPIRALAESIGADVSYDGAANKAIVKYFSKASGSIKVSGSTTVLPIMQAAADRLIAKSGGALSIAVAGGGSGAGVNDTIAGANNVGMSSRDLTADELATLNPVAVASDGIAIIVHPGNPVANLTKEQAAGIFRGEIRNWQDVGGNNAPIFVQTRETGSGTLATLEEMLLDKDPVVETATPFTSSALIKQAVAASENAIGFDSIGYVDSTVKAVSLEGVAVNVDTVKNATYPLSRSLYVFTAGRAAGANAVLIDYLRTLEVQNEIVSKEGYIAIG
ncbi:MAG: substrate-binding domain-containing protein [Clostridiales bacterium]|jgi:phosphate transport system substrate-binding protein|nr:substrate-binding domain-containing protein [Clostridiales bacterium]